MPTKTENRELRKASRAAKPPAKTPAKKPATDVAEPTFDGNQDLNDISTSESEDLTQEGEELDEMDFSDTGDDVFTNGEDSISGTDVAPTRVRAADLSQFEARYTGDEEEEEEIDAGTGSKPNTVAKHHGSGFLPEKKTIPAKKQKAKINNHIYTGVSPEMIKITKRRIAGELRRKQKDLGLKVDMLEVRAQYELFYPQLAKKPYFQDLVLEFCRERKVG